MKLKTPDGLTTPELIDRNDDPICPGDSVTLTMHHAHRGKVATYEGCQRTLAGWAAQVRFEDGERAFVFRSREWQRVEVGNGTFN